MRNGARNGSVRAINPIAHLLEEIESEGGWELDDLPFKFPTTSVKRSSELTPLDLSKTEIFGKKR